MGVNTEGVLVREQDLVRVQNDPAWAGEVDLVRRWGGTLATVVSGRVDHFGNNVFDVLLNDGTVTELFSDEFVVLQSRTTSYID